MARLYSNETFPLPVVMELRRMGHDVLASYEAGNSNQSIPDEQVLEFAVSENRALLTVNRKHFVRLHLASSRHEGVIVCTYDPDSKGQAERIDQALSLNPLLTGCLLRVNRPNISHQHKAQE